MRFSVPSAPIRRAWSACLVFYLIISVFGSTMVLGKDNSPAPVQPVKARKDNKTGIQRTKPQLAVKPTITSTPVPAPSPASTPAAEKPFNDLIKDAEVIKGLFTIYRKDEKIYMEIMPDQFDKVYLFSPTMESGIGERGFLSAQLLNEFPFALQRRGKNVQFVAKNLNFRADSKSAISRAVNRSFADSIMGTAKIESQPHEERKSILIDMNGLMLSDISLIGYALESVYRMPYRLDPKNSAFTSFKGFQDNIEAEALLNYAIERPLVAPLTPQPVPMPNPPLAPPDLRSLQFRVRYSFSKIPESNYRPRLADSRVGHFVTMHQDFTDDRNETPYVRYVNRWNLEKADPNAALSPPKKPIVFWLENAIPEKYRDAVTKGVLEWNKAFEKIGFKDALVAKQQPDDADWDPADVRYNTIRWFVATDAGFAIGPSRTNPYTGEIYDADISFSESITRGARGEFQYLVNPLAAETAPNGMEVISALKNQFDFCNYANEMATEAAFGHNLLLMRNGNLTPEDEEKYVQDLLIHITAHEVGHTLGLRHNFRASTLHSFDKLQDMKLADEYGLTGSVMDYVPVNIAPKGVKQGHYWQTSLGTYDYWAIEYAYKPIAAGSPQGELAELSKIASRVADAKLAYGTDEDINSDPIGIDPRTNRWDFGSDPLNYYEARSHLTHELWDNLETRIPKTGKGYQRLRWAFNTGLFELGNSMLSATKYIGGVYHNRDYVGDPGNRLPYQPVAAKEQRRALELVNKYAFSAEAFEFQPQLLNKLAAERDWTFDGSVFRMQRLDYPIHQQVLTLQRRLLDRLFHPILLSRIQDSEIKYANAADRFTMAELFQELQKSVWSELNTPASVNVNSFRRNLQREHLKRLQRLVLRQDAGTPEDAATLARYNLAQISALISKNLTAKGPRMDTITRAHYQETAARIKETLNAQQLRVAN